MNMETGRARVTSAELVRRFGCWQEEAARQPVYVTHHGRDRLVMLSIASYQALRARGKPVDGEGAAAPLAPMLDHLAEGFLAIDRAFRVVEINPVAAGYLRLVRAGAVGESLPEQVDGFAESLLMSHLARALAAGEIATFIAPSPGYPGRALELRVFPYGEGAGCLMRDVTDEIEGQRRHDEGRAGLAALATHGGIGRARLSPRGTFVEVDAALAAMAGFAPEMLLRARLTDVLPIGRRVAAGSELEAVLASGEPRAFDSALLVNRGAEVPVRIALALLGTVRSAEGATVIVTRR